MLVDPHPGLPGGERDSLERGLGSAVVNPKLDYTARTIAIATRSARPPPTPRRLTPPSIGRAERGADFRPCSGRNRIDRWRVG